MNQKYAQEDKFRFECAIDSLRQLLNEKLEWELLWLVNQYLEVYLWRLATNEYWYYHSVATDKLCFVVGFLTGVQAWLLICTDELTAKKLFDVFNEIIMNKDTLDDLAILFRDSPIED